MPKKAEFLEYTGERKPNRVFVLEYQKSVLLSLQKEGVLDRLQLEECMKKLEFQLKGGDL